MSDSCKMNNEHETFWLKKNEAVYRDDGTTTLRGNRYYPLFYKTIESVEHEYFRCVSQKKMVELNSWDFDYCPFCGKKLAEKEQKQKIKMLDDVSEIMKEK